MALAFRRLQGFTLATALILSLSAVAQAATKPSRHSPPLPANDYSMGPAPLNCPTTAVAYQDQPGKPFAGGRVGRGALVGYSDWVVRDRHATLYVGPHTTYGYPTKVFWQLTRSARGPVLVHGLNIRSGQPVLFGVPLGGDGYQHVFARRAMLVTRQYRRVDVGLPVGHLMLSAFSTVFIPSAGCYEIHASWASGAWTLSFATGCMPVQVNRRMVGVARCRRLTSRGAMRSSTSVISSPG